jgi:nicotinic acid mononucleotide adenylyltransferase
VSERLNWVEMPQLDIAASEIRARVKAGRTIRYQVLDSVWAYIQAYALYQ